VVKPRALRKRAADDINVVAIVVMVCDPGRPIFRRRDDDRRGRVPWSLRTGNDVAPEVNGGDRAVAGVVGVGRACTRESDSAAQAP